MLGTTDTKLNKIPVFEGLKTCQINFNATW